MHKIYVNVELQLEEKSSTRKHDDELKRHIVQQLVDEDILPVSDICLEVYKPQAQQRKQELGSSTKKVELEAQRQKAELDYVLTHKSTINKNKSSGSTKKYYPEVGKKCENVKLQIRL